MVISEASGSWLLTPEKQAAHNIVADSEWEISYIQYIPMWYQLGNLKSLHVGNLSGKLQKALRTAG